MIAKYCLSASLVVLGKKEVGDGGEHGRPGSLGHNWDMELSTTIGA